MPRRGAHSSRGTKLCFTYFPPEGAIVDSDDTVACEGETLCDGIPHFKAGVWQVERCPDTGRLHYQVWLKLSLQL